MHTHDIDRSTLSSSPNPSDPIPPHSIFPPHRYEAVGNFEAEYWKNYGEAWHQWAVAKGYAPSEDSRRAHPEKYNADGTEGTDDKAAADAVPMPGPPAPQFSYWDYLDPAYYREKAAEWEKYAQEQGYLPVLEEQGEGPRDMPRRLDAFDDRMDRYEAVADFEKAYWKAYADGWVQWTQDMGYMPSPESQRLAAAKAAKEAKAAGASRRLDAYDDRMDGYKAVADFEKAYWKAYADGWVQWAQGKGYMPTPAGAQKQQRVGPEDDAGYVDVPRRGLDEDDAGYVDVPRRGLDAYDDRMARYQAVGQKQADYWQRYGDSWTQWAIQQGYMPAPGQQPQQDGQGQQGEQQPRRLDAYDDRMGRYQAIGQSQGDYWQRYGNGWTQWAIQQGYVPAPGQQAQGQQQTQGEQPQQARRLDAYDDRMNRYDAVASFEADYWKR